MAASVLLLFSTACTAAQARGAADRVDPTQPGQVQSYKGGMNNFKDTVRDTSAADAKAKALRDRVSQNIRDKRADSVDQYVENYRNGAPIQERTRKLADDIGEGAENAATDAKNFTKDFSRNTQKSLDRGGKDFSNKVSNGAEGVKDNLTGARDRLGDQLEQDGKVAARKANETANDVQRSAKGIVQTVKDKVDDATDSVRRAADDLVD